MNSLRLSLSLCIIALLVMGQSCIRINSGQGGSDNTVWRSDDHGETWTPKDFVSQVTVKKKTQTVTISGVSAREIISSRIHPEALYLTTETSGVYVSNNRGDQWTPTNYRTFVRGFSTDALNENVLYVTGGATMQKTIDAGGEWLTKFTVTKPAELLVGLMVDFFNPNRIILGSNLGVVYLSEDAGETWTIISTLEDTLTNLIGSPTDSRVLFAQGTQTPLWRSTDGGSTWTAVSDALQAFEGAVQNLRLWFVPRSGNLYATSQYGLLRSRDQAASWESVRTLLPPPIAIDSITVDPDNELRITFVVGNKLHRTANGGADWTVTTLPMRRPAAFVVTDPLDSNVLYIGTKIPPKK